MSIHSDYLEKAFTRRTLLFSALQALCGVSLIGRLGYLNRFKGDNYQNLADRNRIRIHFRLPRRGEILDRHGVPLASSVHAYRLVIHQDQVQEREALLRRLESLVNLSQEEQEDLIAQLKFRPKFIPTTVRDYLNWSDVCALEARLHDVQGLGIEESWVRNYPFPRAFCHILGYVRSPSKADRKIHKLAELSDSKLGQVGIERAQERSLQGEAGFEKIEVNARGERVGVVSTRAAMPGKTVHLSIDQKLQSYIYQKMSAYKSAAAVVMDIGTGEVLASVSHPGYDSSIFCESVPHHVWQSLISDPARPLNNKIIQGLYPPGSIFKMVVVLAALESGLISPHHGVSCSGHVTLGSHRFHCWHKWGGHGSVGVTRALSESCDVFFYNIAAIVGPERIAEMARKLGYGQKFDLSLEGELGGLVPTPEWLKKQQKRNWSRGDTLNIGIGQGAMLATPLQMCVATARLMGRAVVPTLYKPMGTEDTDFADLGLNPRHLKLVQKGLDKTVNVPGGLAYRHRIKASDLQMAGKTATCQVKRITMTERRLGIFSNSQRPWEHRDHALFSGYAPVHDPKYAVCVVIEHGGSGGRIAAPVGRDLLYFAQTGREYRPEAAPPEDLTNRQATDTRDAVSDRPLEFLEDASS